MTKILFTEDQETKIIEDYKNKNTILDIASRNQVSPQTVTRLLEKYQIYITKKPLAIEVKNSIAQEYTLTNTTCQKLAKQYNVSSSVVIRLLRKRNIPIRDKRNDAAKILDSDKERVIEEYLKNGENTCCGLARKYNVQPSAVVHLLKQNKIEIRGKTHADQARRKDKFNQNFFEKIDTPEKAYFLGWLYADGYNNPEFGKTSLQLQSTDNEILEKLKHFIGSSKALEYKERPARKYKQQVIRASKSVSLFLRSKKLSRDLVALGCVQRKSLILKFPTKEQVPEHLVKFFILGMWEGDGGLCYRTKPNSKYLGQRFYLVSTFEFCSSLQEILKNKLGIHVTVSRARKENESNTFYLQCGKLSSLIKFMEWIYLDAPFKLPRKYKIYKEILRLAKNKKRVKSLLDSSPHFQELCSIPT